MLNSFILLDECLFLLIDTFLTFFVNGELNNTVTKPFLRCRFWTSLLHNWCTQKVCLSRLLFLKTTKKKLFEASDATIRVVYVQTSGISFFRVKQRK